MPANQFIPGWIPGLLTEAAPVELVEEVTTIMSKFHPVGYRVMVRGFADADLRHVLPTIEIPSLLLYGSADKRSPLTVAHELHAKIPRSRLTILQGVGHLSNVEAAARFNTEVRDFVLSHDSPA
jgi:pimeloyl-ACP methyl ester carboxylesterase